METSSLTFSQPAWFFALAIVPISPRPNAAYRLCTSFTLSLIMPSSGIMRGDTQRRRRRMRR